MPTAYGYMAEIPAESLESQRKSIASYAGRKLAGEFQRLCTFGDYADALRTPFIQRKGGAAILERLQEGDALVFSRLDVAFFRRSDLRQMLGVVVGAKRAAVHIVEENLVVPDRYAADTIIAFVHHTDRMADAPRRRAIKKTLAERRERGLPSNGEAPIGFKLVGKGDKQKMVPDEEEQAVMRFIHKLRHEGRPFSEIRLYLRQMDVKFRRKVGRKWELREWSESRIRRAYEAYLKLRHEEKMKAEAGELVGAGT